MRMQPGNPRSKVACLTLALALSATVSLPSQAAVPFIGKPWTVVSGCPSTGEATPKGLAAHSSLIIDAKVTKKHPAGWVMGHAVANPRIDDGNYAWHDFTLSQVHVIWKDKGQRDPGSALTVRVYRAEAPAFIYSNTNEPDFVEGEHYLLFLLNGDGLASDVGPVHWGVTAGSEGAFLLSGDRVSRKIIESYGMPPMTLEGVLKSVLDGLKDEINLAFQRSIRSQRRNVAKFPPTLAIGRQARRPG